MCELRKDQLNNGVWLEQRIRLGRASAPAGRPGRAASTYMAAIPACQFRPAKIHVRNYYGISNILLFVLGKAKVLLSWLDCFSYPSRPSQVLFSWTIFLSELMPFQKIIFYHSQYIDMDSSNYFRPLDLYKIRRSKFFLFFWINVGISWSSRRTWWLLLTFF